MKTQQVNPEDTLCIRCGQPTETKIDETPLCDECYVTRASCCPEFGVDDLAKDCIQQDD